MVSINDIPTVRAAAAYCKDGNKVGRVGDVYVDDLTNEPAWVTITAGLFGTKTLFAPLVGATVEGDRLILAYDKETIASAPTIADSGHISDTEQQALIDYYAARTPSGAPEATQAQEPPAAAAAPLAGGVAGMAAGEAAQQQPEPVVATPSVAEGTGGEPAWAPPAQEEPPASEDEWAARPSRVDWEAPVEPAPGTSDAEQAWAAPAAAGLAGAGAAAAAAQSGEANARAQGGQEQGDQEPAAGAEPEVQPGQPSVIDATVLDEGGAAEGVAAEDQQPPADAEASDQPGPGYVQPDASQPDASQPDASQPDASQPDAAQPDAAQPEGAQPDAVQPEGAQPEGAQPEGAQPDAEQGEPRHQPLSGVGSSPGGPDDSSVRHAQSGQFRMHPGHTRETVYRDSQGNILYSVIHTFEEIFGGGSGQQG